MKKIFLIHLVIIGVIFSGCAKFYDIKPEYNQGGKTLLIGDYTIKKISYYNKKRSNLNAESMGNTGYWITSIRSDSGVCSNIEIIEYKASGKWFYYHSAKEDILKRYKNNCNLEKVGDNLNFIQCSYNYFITSSIMKYSGYGEKRTIKLDKHCFVDMKEHFESQTKKENIVTMQPITNKTQPKSTLYRGDFVSTRASKCASTGDIVLTIRGEKAFGYISYQLNGKPYTSDITANIIGNKLGGNTENIRFIGIVLPESIEGSYSGKNCKGMFKAKLESSF